MNLLDHFTAAELLAGAQAAARYLPGYASYWGTDKYGNALSWHERTQAKHL